MANGIRLQVAAVLVYHMTTFIATTKINRKITYIHTYITYICICPMNSFLIESLGKGMGGGGNRYCL